MREASKDPCKNCPWLTENHGKRHPDGWFSKANRTRLWNGIRSGEAPGMTCHPTDPNNEVSDKAKEKGYKEAPEHAETRECAGAVILIQKELMLFQDVVEAGGDYKDYRQQSGSPMRREVLLAHAMRASGMPAIMTGLPVPMRKDHDLRTPVALQ